MSEKIEQTEKQKYSKSPLYGYRKPHKDDSGNTWCSCTIPTLTPIMARGGGQAYCLRCHHNWYH